MSHLPRSGSKPASSKQAMLTFLQSTIGQAHLLDSIIDNLELEAESPPHASGKSYYARRTLTYGLGEQVRRTLSCSTSS